MIQLKIIDETKIDQVTGVKDSAQDYLGDKDWPGNSNRGQFARNTLNLGQHVCCARKMIYTKTSTCIRVEWFTILAIFENGNIVVDKVYFCELNFRKIGKYGSRTAKFSFSKNHRSLKNSYFVNTLQISSFYFKERLSNGKFEETF